MKKIIKSFKIFAIKTFVNIHTFFLQKKNALSAKPKRFLIVTTTGIGDTLWGIPAIKSLKKTFPESYIGILTNSLGAEILREDPNIDGIFVFKRGLSGVFSLPMLAKTFKQKRFDVVFIFHASDRIVWFISFLTGANEIIGYEEKNKDMDFILTKKMPSNNNIHGITARLNLLKEVKVDAFDNHIHIYLTDEDRENAEKFLTAYGIKEETLLIGFHPGAQKMFKRWHKNNFIELGNMLAKRFGCRIIITGSSDEAMLSDEIASNINGAVSCAGGISLRTTAAIIERMNLFITNDTGPMHIAFALKTPTVALFSPTDPISCGPYYAENVIVIKKPITCSPCIGKNCDNPVCMEQIKIEEVIAAAESLLNEKKVKHENCIKL